MSIANSFAKKRRAPIEQPPPPSNQYNPNAFRNGPQNMQQHSQQQGYGQQSQSQSQQQQQQQQAPASGFTLPQVIALIDKRLVTIERQVVDLKDTLPPGDAAMYQHEQFAQDKVSIDDFQIVLKEFNDKFEMLADEFANYKNSIMTLQSFTMEVNQKLSKQLDDTNAALRLATKNTCKCASAHPPQLSTISSLPPISTPSQSAPRRSSAPMFTTTAPPCRDNGEFSYFSKEGPECNVGPDRFLQGRSRRETSNKIEDIYDDLCGDDEGDAEDDYDDMPPLINVPTQNYNHQQQQLDMMFGEYQNNQQKQLEMLFGHGASNDLRDSFVVSPAFDTKATAALPPRLSLGNSFSGTKCRIESEYDDDDENDIMEMDVDEVSDYDPRASSQKIPVYVPVQVPVSVPVKVPVQVPVSVPVKVPVQVQPPIQIQVAQAPVQAPVQAPKSVNTKRNSNHRKFVLDDNKKTE